MKRPIEKVATYSKQCESKVVSFTVQGSENRELMNQYQLQSTKLIITFTV